MFASKKINIRKHWEIFQLVLDSNGYQGRVAIFHGPTISAIEMQSQKVVTFKLMNCNIETKTTVRLRVFGV